MKVVREYINEKFTDESDPIRDMGIGMKPAIEKWLRDNDIYDYVIKSDLTINTKSGVNIKREALIDGKLPNFIQFNIVYEYFDIQNAGLISLRGCPYEIRGSHSYYGNFWAHENKLISLKYIPKIIEGRISLFSNPKQWSKKYIKSRSKIGRDIILIEP